MVHNVLDKKSGSDWIMSNQQSVACLADEFFKLNIGRQR